MLRSITASCAVHAKLDRKCRSVVFACLYFQSIEPNLFGSCQTTIGTAISVMFTDVRGQRLKFTSSTHKSNI